MRFKSKAFPFTLIYKTEKNPRVETVISNQADWDNFVLMNAQQGGPTEVTMLSSFIGYPNQKKKRFYWDNKTGTPLKFMLK